jgi:hypothetical protein
LLRFSNLLLLLMLMLLLLPLQVLAQVLTDNLEKRSPGCRC